MSASWEDARRCYECKMVGAEKGRSAGRTGVMRGSTIITLECKNSRCSNNNTPWIVQIRPDGSIPEPTLDREKEFQIVPSHIKERGRRIVEGLEAQVASELEEGTEILSPWR